MCQTRTVKQQTVTLILTSLQVKIIVCHVFYTHHNIIQHVVEYYCLYSVLL